MKKKLICTMLAGVMAASVLAGCGGDGKTAAGTVKDEDGITIPEKITVMVDGTLVTKSNGQQEFIDRWEELTGIELEIIQPSTLLTTMYWDRRLPAVTGRMSCCSALLIIRAMWKRKLCGI